MQYVKIGDEKYEYDPSKITFEEAEYIQDKTGLTLVPFLNGIGEGNAKSVRGILWLVKNRSGTAVRYEDLGHYNLLDIELVDDDESSDLEKAAAEAGDPTPGDAVAVVEAIAGGTTTGTSTPEPSTSST